VGPYANFIPVLSANASSGKRNKVWVSEATLICALTSYFHLFIRELTNKIGITLLGVMFFINQNVFKQQSGKQEMDLFSVGTKPDKR